MIQDIEVTKIELKLKLLHELIELTVLTVNTDMNEKDSSKVLDTLLSYIEDVKGHIEEI